ncbi:hypothetical protein CJD36_002000 [Flavipsychrobacter stenotrophus]|uniref:Secretion system C-terminal sorting domain-containing protein n=1 Tax=Flavipsychrobacter stenotrophus TaxID=2077091 RepID=A0A2S7T028_9BACT|nr:T9SS type A sorting domain-containing protein [Flavipsychrobacter stenotrophus]PQJ12542.1 hypothetical protein CJD36_002000 [Flavipsychrobacter stenotrophus]
MYIIRLNLLALVLTISTSLWAQVPNPGFEQLNIDGTTRNWGNIYLFSGVADTYGNFHMDSVVYTNTYFYTPTSDAHSGTRALEIGNGYNYTTGQCIVGAVGADTDSVFMAYGGFDFIPATVAPATFSFYYKYLPLNNDTGVARLVVYDSFMTALGMAEIFLSDTHSTYTLASTPVVMTAAGNVGFISVAFSTSTFGHPATFGTRLLIDDVGASTTGVADISNADHKLICYPTVAGSQLNVGIDGLTHNTNAAMKIMDISGRTLRTENLEFAAGMATPVNVESLSAGTYVISETIATGNYIARFIK